MPETKTQSQSSSANEQGVTRRSQYAPERGIFSPFMGFDPFAMMRRFTQGFGLDAEPWRGWSPAIEVHEKDGNLEVTAELPGMKKDDVKIETTDEGLVIQGEKRDERQETHEGYRRSERSYGHFCRMIPLPQGAETDKAKAEFKDGVLRVSVPIPQNQQQKRRQIPIGS